MFSFSRSFFLLFLVFFVRGVRFGEVASLPATPSIFFFFVLVPPFEEVTTVELVVTVSSRLSLYDEKKKRDTYIIFETFGIIFSTTLTWSDFSSD